jgi:site-specific DNA-cytosine methylase
MKKLRVLDLFAGRKGWSRRFAERGHDVVTLDYDPAFECDITADILQVTGDMLELYGPFEVVCASPPCEAFSVAALSRNWWVVERCRNCGEEVRLVKRGKGSDHQWAHRVASLDATCTPRAVISADPVIEPRHERALHGQAMVEQTLKLIQHLQPKAWVMENPTAMMRRLPILKPYHLHPITYCQVGEDRMKPTDLWLGGAFRAIDLPGPCKTRRNIKNLIQGQLVTMPDGRTFVTNAVGEPCHESAPRGAKTGTQGLANSADRAVIPIGLSERFCDAAERMLL